MTDEVRMPRDLTAEMRAAAHRAAILAQRAVVGFVVTDDDVEDVIARRLACPVQRRADEAVYAALLGFGVRTDG